MDASYNGVSKTNATYNGMVRAVYNGVRASSAGLSKTPGSKTANISTSTLSRAFCPKPTPLPTDAISITAGGQYQLKVSGIWQPLTSVSGTWGTATACRVARTSSDVYATPETAVLTIGLVPYTFTVNSRGALVSDALAYYDGDLVVEDGKLESMNPVVVPRKTYRSVQAMDIFVDTNLPENGDGSENDPFNTIEASYAAASDGDAILFLPGIHSIETSISILKGIHIGSYSGSPLDTIIDFCGSPNLWNLKSHTGTLTLDALMIKNSIRVSSGEAAVQLSGAGLSDTIIQRCIFMDNNIHINIINSNATIRSNKFVGVRLALRNIYTQSTNAVDYRIDVNYNVFGPSNNFTGGSAVYARSATANTNLVNFNNNVVLLSRGINSLYGLNSGTKAPTFTGRNNSFLTAYSESPFALPLIGGATSNSELSRSTVLSPHTSTSTLPTGTSGVTVTDFLNAEPGIKRYPRKGFLSLGIDDTLAYTGTGGMKTDDLIAALDSYGLAMTWFVTSGDIDDIAKGAIKRWLDAGHEIGLHGLSHASLIATVGLTGVVKAGTTISISIDSTPLNVKDWSGTVTIDGGNSVTIDGNIDDTSTISRMYELKTWLEGEGCSVTGPPEFVPGMSLAVSLADQTSLSIDGIGSNLSLDTTRYQTAEIVYGKYVLEARVRTIDGYSDYTCVTASAPFNDNNSTGMNLMKDAGLLLTRSDDNADVGFVNMYGASAEYPLNIFSIGDCIFNSEDTWFGSLLDSAAMTVTPAKAYGFLCWLATQGAVSGLYIHKDTGPMSYLTDFLDMAIELSERGNLMVGSYAEIANHIRSNGTMIEGDGSGSVEQWYLDFEENYGDYDLLPASPCIAAGTNPFTTADGDQYDAAGNKVYDATYDKVDGYWLNGVDIGAYSYSGNGLYYHATIVSGTTLADYVITLPEAPELIAADTAGTWFTAGVANEVSLATLSPTTKTRIGPDGLIVFGIELGVPSQESIDIILGVTP